MRATIDERTSSADAVRSNTAETRPASAAISHAPPGRGSIAVVRRDGRSFVSRAYATSPLRLLTPANHGIAAWVYTSSFGGGLVDGDEMTLDIDVGRGGAAFVSTQSATKVYRSPHGTKAITRGIVRSEGLLVVAPDPVVPFAGARYRQLQRYDVAADAGLVVVDSVVSGRRASGERWQFSEYLSVIEIRIGGRLRVYDPVALRAADGDLIGRFGRFDVLALAIVAGGLLRTEIACVLERAQQPLRRRADQVVAASSIGDDGCIVRVGGTATEAVCRTLRDLLRFVPARLADDPWVRKW